MINILLFLLGLISFIPIIDIIITKFIYNIKFTKSFCSLFSKYIIYFNLLFNILLFYFINWKVILLRYFIELFIINFCLKWLLDRPRPRNSLLKNNKYHGIKDIKISNNWQSNQSFPSGHVCTIYCSYYLLKYFMINTLLEFIFLLLLSLTIYSRMNLGSHHFSDCIWAIIISKIMFLFVNVITF